MNNKQKQLLKKILGYYIGKASMCWSEVPKGVFESTKALNILEDSANNIEHMLNNEHLESSECWCEPILKNDFTEKGGVKHYVHNSLTNGDQSE